jgi:hypothetical protein
MNRICTKPVLQYGCEALLTATPAILNKLEVMQNQVLRLMTGAVNSTALASMQVVTMNNPLQIKKAKMALIMHEKLTHLPYSSYLSQYKYQDRNLNIKNSFTKNCAIMTKVHLSGRTRKLTPSRVLSSEI